MYCAYCGTEVASLAMSCPACGKPASGAPVVQSTGTMHPAAIAAMVIAGVMVIVAIVGIVAAIAIPNLLHAVQRGRQKRTMADIRTVGEAVEDYSLVHSEYPDAASMDELARLLEPDHIAALPRTDGWENELWYESWQEDPESPGGDRYRIVSAGRDLSFEAADVRDYVEGTISGDFDTDIVYGDAVWVQYPDGSSR